MPKKNVETPQSTGESVAGTGAEVARANKKKLAGAEDNPGAVAKRLHEQGKAAAAKHGA